MEFTLEDMDLLIKCANEYERIIIEGINHYGQAFRTNGFILNYLSDDGSPMYISNHSIGIFFGQKQKYKGKKYDMFATFYTTYKGNYDALYISRILDSHKNEIFVNKDFVEIEKTILENLQEDDLSLTAKQLTHLIAKPVVIDEQMCVLKGIRMIEGMPYIDATTGLNYIGTMVDNQSDIKLDIDALKKLDRINRTYGGQQKNP